MRSLINNSKRYALGLLVLSLINPGKKFTVTTLFQSGEHFLSHLVVKLCVIRLLFLLTTLSSMKHSLEN
jgi:hypothetical protein